MYRSTQSAGAQREAFSGRTVTSLERGYGAPVGVHSDAAFEGGMLGGDRGGGPPSEAVAKAGNAAHVQAALQAGDEPLRRCCKAQPGTADALVRGREQPDRRAQLLQPVPASENTGFRVYGSIDGSFAAVRTALLVCACNRCLQDCSNHSIQSLNRFFEDLHTSPPQKPRNNLQVGKGCSQHRLLVSKTSSLAYYFTQRPGAGSLLYPKH